MQLIKKKTEEVYKSVRKTKKLNQKLNIVQNLYERGDSRRKLRFSDGWILNEKNSFCEDFFLLLVIFCVMFFYANNLKRKGIKKKRRFF